VQFSRLRLQQVAQEITNAQQQEAQAWVRLKQWVPEAQTAFVTLQSQQHMALPKTAASLAAELLSLDLTQCFIIAAHLFKLHLANLILIL
jgi:hypothetical protein